MARKLPVLAKLKTMLLGWL